MTETTARIRWETGQWGNLVGYVGTIESWLFQIWFIQADSHWSLVTSLPGVHDKSSFRNINGDDPDALKAEAERWLGEFTTSLGAVFGDAVAADLRSRADEMESYAGGGEEGRHDRSMFATGMRRSAALIEHGDVPATSAPVAADNKE